MTTQFPSIADYLTTDASSPIELPELSAEDSYKLLYALAAKAVEQDPSAAHDLLRKVGGIPLAIELMGNYLKEASRKIKSRESVQNAFKTLRSIAGRREIVLNKLISAIYEQLSLSTQAALRLLTVFPSKPNTFSEEVALAVAFSKSATAGSMDTLNILSDNGLLKYNPVEERLMLHPIVHDYALSIVDADTPLAYQRMMTFYSVEVQQRGEEWRTTLRDHLNLCAALEHANNAAALEGILAFYPYLEANGFYQLAWTHLRRVRRWLTHIEADAQLPGREDKLATILLYLGRAIGRQGKYLKAKKYFEAGLAVAQSCGNVSVEVEINHWLINILIHLGQYDVARLHLQDWIAHARIKNERAMEQRLLFDYGLLAYTCGDFDSAVTRLRESMVIADDIGSFDGRTLTRINLSEILLFTGTLIQYDYKSIETLLTESLLLAETAGHKDRQAYCLAIKGLLNTAMGQNRDAEENFKVSLDLTKATGNQYLQSLALVYRGDLYFIMNYFDAAFDDYTEGLQIAKTHDYREHAALGLFGLAKLSMAVNKRGEAANLSHESQKIFMEMGHFMANRIAAWMVAHAIELEVR